MCARVERLTYSESVGALRVLVSEISYRQPIIALPIGYKRPVHLPFVLLQCF